MKYAVAWIVALIAVFFAGSSAGSVRPSPGDAAHPAAPAAPAAPATATYDNALIADTALRYVGKPGWLACADAGRSGLTGGPTPVQPQFDSNGKLVKEGDGQCRAFVNCIVWIASGHTQWLGGGANYFSSFLNPNGGPAGLEIKDVSKLVKGDIVQQGATASASNLHTYIIVASAPRKTDTATTRTFTVVDSNHDYKENVLSYPRAITLGPNERAFRMGSPAPAESLTAIAQRYAQRTYIDYGGVVGKVYFQPTRYRASVIATDGSTITAFAIWSTVNGLAVNSSWAVTLFRGRRFLGWADPRATMFLALGRPQSHAIRVIYSVYSKRDPTCCPSSRKTVRYRWNGSRIVASAKAPLIYGKPGPRLHLG